jgi:arylsulfatase A-like enzyme
VSILALRFKANGYHTAQIGKWHTGVDTGNGRDWNHQIVWNRPAHPDNAGHYFYDQIVTFNGKDRRVEGYSTDNYTDWAIDYIKGENRDSLKSRGTCGSATERFMVQPHRLNVTKEV